MNRNSPGFKLLVPNTVNNGGAAVGVGGGVEPSAGAAASINSSSRACKSDPFSPSKIW